MRNLSRKSLVMFFKYFKPIKSFYFSIGLKIKHFRQTFLFVRELIGIKGLKNSSLN